ncbi:MAG: TonB-dependent receptor [Gemmatimonadetes bacterium]|nr:TonB-dependent receptor [Gemmatimonadota bacterium]
MRMALLTGLFLLAAPPLHAQGGGGEGTLRLRVESNGTPLAGAEVRAGRIALLTDESGRALLRLPAGRHIISVELIGYARGSAPVDVRAGMDSTLVLALEAEVIEGEAIIVLSTRTGRRIEEEPVRVEVLAREEVEEKMLMTPGDISMMLNETSGLRVQTTSPSLGGANVRIQGLRGRYTQILSDGLPLYGGQSGALSMLQIPPMDLGQVEVIKGVASALYGASALGGVVNLISRRPAGDRELLLNQTTRGGTDAILWSSGELSERWGYSFLGSGHRQAMHDVDDDGWADLSGHRRAVVRPRLFWNDGAGRSLFVTVGGTAENRDGGTLNGATTPAGTRYVEALDTRRVDAGLVGRALLGGDRLLSVRASAMGQRHDHRFGEVRERDLHTTAFGEVALTATDRGHTWVIGAALQHEGYEATDVAGFDDAGITPSLFVQDEVSPADWLTIAASGRLDLHDEHGAFFNPRVSVLLRPGVAWTARASVGTGYFAPTPFTEETEVVGLTAVAPLGDLEPERARSASLDLGRRMGSLELNGTLFGSEVRDPLMARPSGDSRLQLFNASGSIRTYGADLLARFHEEPFHLTATYTHTRSTEQDPETGDRREVPLTPRHAAGAVGMWEAEDEGRVGVELYYTGRQELENNPYRDVSRPYLVVGFLVERRLGSARLFLNAENLLDARQTRFDPLLLPFRAEEGRWTTDAWAPLEGRTFNAGVRLDL